jgi:hypothetical protein
VNNTYGLTSSIGNFFGNLQGPSVNFTRLGSEALLTAKASRVLSLGMWGLAVVGLIRQLRQGRPTLSLAVLAFSPLALLVLLTYGHEGVMRAYLFSLPWTVCLAAYALRPTAEAFWHPRAILRTAVIAVVVALFLVAFFGEDGSSVITPADMQTSVFLYTHARPGPLMLLNANFPSPIGGNSYEFDTVGSLLGSDYPGITRLSPSDIPFVTTEIASYGGGSTAPGYFVVSPSMFAYAEEFGMATAAQCRIFVAAMERAPAWRILYNRGGTTIYELAAGA